MDKKTKKNEISVFKADLHIHTPASKCYKGNKDDKEYIRILEKASEKGLNIIAITDHNSIDGYKKLIEQKEKIISEINAYEKIDDSAEAKKIIKENEKTLKLFNSTLILPGVEFEVNNGIHMLVVFNPKTEISTIIEFLKKGGFDEDSFGKENDVFSNWSLFNFYEKVREYDCLIFDAHTDSDKGIYNTLEGTPRIHAFTDNALVGICYKSEKQKNCIKNLFLDPKYKRTSPIAFLKSSDAHKTDEIGKDKTFFRIDKLDWQSFKTAFLNPDECVFTSNPKIQTIINNISSTGRCAYIPSICENHIEEFAKCICGLSNADGGYIIVGADNKDVVNGIEIKGENAVQGLTEFINKTIAKIGGLHPSINSYPLKDDYIIFIIKIDKGEQLIDIDKNGEVYYFRNGKVDKLNAVQIQQILSQRIEAKYQLQISKELSFVRKHISAIETYLKSQPILSAYSKNSSSISEYISDLNLIEPTKLTPEQKQILNEHYKQRENGCLKGGLIYIKNETSPRLKNAYLRITPPKFNLKNIKKVSNGKCLYVIPGGAVFYSESELNYYNGDDMPILKIDVSDQYPMKFLCAFLKSSFFLWYVKNKFGDFDFFPSDIFNCIDIPILHLKNPEDKKLIENIENNVDEIIKLEKKFLSIDWKVLTGEQANNEVNKHNGKTSEIFMNIDNLIFNLLKIGKEEICVIKENLKANGIYMVD